MGTEDGKPSSPAGYPTIRAVRNSINDSLKWESNKESSNYNSKNKNNINKNSKNSNRSNNCNKNSNNKKSKNNNKITVKAASAHSDMGVEEMLPPRSSSLKMGKEEEEEEKLPRKRSALKKVG